MRHDMILSSKNQQLTRLNSSKTPLSASHPRPLVLASTSAYRAQLLSRLLVPFITVAPASDETAVPGEVCRATAVRLAAVKAAAGAARSGLTDALVIGSDQVADLDGVALGKPLSVENAFSQLRSMRARKVVFHTALALLDIRSGRLQQAVVATVVTMRDYPDAAIEFYLSRENALDCAGSAKSEGLGAALIESMTSDDPTALVGLPLLSLVSMLQREGFEVLS